MTSTFRATSTAVKCAVTGACVATAAAIPVVLLCDDIVDENVEVVLHHEDDDDEDEFEEEEVSVQQDDVEGWFFGLPTLADIMREQFAQQFEDCDTVEEVNLKLATLKTDYEGQNRWLGIANDEADSRTDVIAIESIDKHQAWALKGSKWDEGDGEASVSRSILTDPSDLSHFEAVVKLALTGDCYFDLETLNFDPVNDDHPLEWSLDAALKADGVRPLWVLFKALEALKNWYTPTAADDEELDAYKYQDRTLRDYRPWWNWDVFSKAQENLGVSVSISDGVISRVTNHPLPNTNP